MSHARLRPIPGVLIAGGALLVAACVRHGAPAPRYSSRSADLPPTQITDVQQVKDLPEGIALERDRLEIAKDFPTAEDPHRLIGELSLPFDTTPDRFSEENNRKSRAQIAASAAKVTAEHGGNAYFLDGTRAYVLHLSSAAPAFPPASELLDQAKLVPEPYKESMRAKRSLEKLEPVSVAMKHHTCYAAMWALAPTAKIDRRLGGRGVWAFYADKEVPKGPPKNSSGVIGWAGPNIQSRIHYVPLGCTGVDATIAYRLGAGENVPVGEGEAEIRVYAWQPKADVRRSACTVCRDGTGHSTKCLGERFDITSSGICE
jgi:hypothetical protein